MIREERKGSDYFATIHTERTEVGSEGEIQVFGVNLSDIVTVPSGMRAYVKVQLISTAVDTTTPEYSVIEIDGMVLNNGGTISVGTGGASTIHANDHAGADEITASLVSGTSGFGVFVDPSGFETTGNYNTAIITVAAHTYDTGA